MRHVKSFSIEEGKNREDLCDQINAYAKDNNLSVFNITFNHIRSAFVIFEEQQLRDCSPAGSLESILINTETKPITISMDDAQ